MDAHFTLTIDLGNDAMQNERDVARALRKVADKLDRGRLDRAAVILDTNGNKVGSYSLTNDYYEN